MGIKSQKNGKKFEEELCNFFSKQGFYVIYNERNSSGAQPVDIVISKKNIITLVEAKNLENKNGKFTLDRIEENQRLAYKKFRKCDNSNMILAIKWNNSVYFIDFGLLQFFNESIDLKSIKPNIEEWSTKI